MSTPRPHDDYSSFRLGRFTIHPPDASPSDDFDLLMQRGAFGSGEHETTASCVDILGGLDTVKGAKLLDLGSGTAILALAALRLGAAHATCVDTSPSAVDSARANGQLNHLEGRIDHIVGTIDAVNVDDYDLVIANLYGDLLVDLAAPIVARTRPGATILLSGILWEYSFPVKSSFAAQGCQVVETRMLSEFVTMVLRCG
jgi:ribosomal protein L11 methyltransferase